MNKLISYLSALDWLVSGCTLALGLYQQNVLLIGVGVLGLLLAWFKPAARVKAYLEKRFLRKKAVHSDTQAVLAEDAFYAQVLDDGALDPAPAVSDTPANFSANLPAGALRFSGHRHNLVQARHLNLAPLPAARDWA